MTTSGKISENSFFFQRFKMYALAYIAEHDVRFFVRFNVFRHIIHIIISLKTQHISYQIDEGFRFINCLSILIIRGDPYLKKSKLFLVQICHFINHSSIVEINCFFWIFLKVILFSKNPKNLHKNRQILITNWLTNFKTFFSNFIYIYRQTPYIVSYGLSPAPTDPGCFMAFLIVILYKMA